MLKEYKPLEIPEGMSEGLLFNIASSRQLDVFGKDLGVKRKTFLFLKEPDFLYKIRIRNKNIQLKAKEKSPMYVPREEQEIIAEELAQLFHEGESMVSFAKRSAALYKSYDEFTADAIMKRVKRKFLSIELNAVIDRYGLQGNNKVNPGKQ